MHEEDIARLEEIRDEIEMLTREAMKTVRAVNWRAAAAAEAYWYAHIMTALGGQDSNYRTHATTMWDTIEGLVDNLDLDEYPDLDDDLG